MEWQVFEILEEKIDQVVRKMEVLSRENQEFKEKIKEKEDLIQNAQITHRYPGRRERAHQGQG